MSDQKIATSEEIKTIASEHLFGERIVENVYRSVVVEAMISVALPEWKWCSGGYSSFDFKHPDDTRLEVKQSAIKQTWKPKKPVKPSWDIKARKGKWVDGSDWVPGAGRNADIYVLALHIREDEAADQRDPSQWSFFVILTSELPDRSRLSLEQAQSLSPQHSFADLPDAVRRIHGQLAGRGD